MSLLDDWRYRNAFEMGRKEHVTSRILGVLLIAVSIYLVLSDPGTPRFEGLKYLWFCATLLWIVYFFFHKMEKWLYPSR